MEGAEVPRPSLKFVRIVKENMKKTHSCKISHLSIIHHDLSFILPHSEQVHHWLSITLPQNEHCQVAGAGRGGGSDILKRAVACFFFLGGLSVRSITSVFLSKTPTSSIQGRSV